MNLVVQEQNKHQNNKCCAHLSFNFSLGGKHTTQHPTTYNTNLYLILVNEARPMSFLSVSSAIRSGDL